MDPVTGKQLVWTRTENDKQRPTKPFPDKQYLRYLTDIYYNENEKYSPDRLSSETYRSYVVYVEKSRQMIISTLTCLYILWECMFIPARRWLISKTIENDAKELIRDKIRAPYEMLPDWFREAYPVSLEPQGLVECYNTKSYIQAVTENVAHRTARGGTASGVLIDEAAYQDATRDIMQASIPMTDKVILVSTPALAPGGLFMKGQIEKADKGDVLDMERLVLGEATEIRDLF